MQFACGIGHQAKMNFSHNDARRPPAKGVATETELKLTGPSKILRRIFADPIIETRAASDQYTRRLRSEYYDTNERRLKNRGLALRVRTEWTKALPDANPTLLHLEFPDLLDRMGLVQTGNNTDTILCRTLVPICINTLPEIYEERSLQ